MFKKANHIILSVLLLIASIGLTISKHYCAGDLISTSLFVEANDCCGDVDSCTNEDSCENESTFFHLDDDFSLTTTNEIPVSKEIEVFQPASITLAEDVVSNNESLDFIISNSPPPQKTRTALSKRQSYLL